MFFRDSDIQRIFALIEQRRFHFDEQRTPKSADVISIDRLLYTLDALGYLVRTHVLPLKDVGMLSYRVLEVFDNPDLKGYLAYLDQRYQEHGTPITPHKDALWLVDQLRNMALSH